MNRSEAASHVAAFLSRPRNARFALVAGAALFELGEVELAVAVWTLGDDANPMIRRLKDHPDAPEQGRHRSVLADATLCEFLTGLHAKAVDEFEARTGDTVDRVRNAVWPLTHGAPVTYRKPMQRPVIFYMPDLPAAPVEPNDAFEWVAILEAACDTIRREYEIGMRAGVNVQPYVPAGTPAPEWAELGG
ncbi:MAG: hypothetical protein WBW61_13035, partial [Rhodanobacteraceae bacterium]